MKSNPLQLIKTAAIASAVCGSLLSGPLAQGKAEAPAKPQLVLVRHQPCNLFDTSEPVRFDLEIKGFPAGKGDVEVRLLNEFGKEVLRKSLSFEGEEGKPVSLDLGKQVRGYYDVILRAKVREADDQLVGTSLKASLGVMEFVSRTAKEARDGGYIFGLKWWGGIVSQREMEDAMAKLGLQWTRIMQNEGGNKEGRMSAPQILTDFPMNAVIKVERFPRELFDDQRYGSIEEWEKKFGRGSWVIKSLPKKEEYKKWLKEQLDLLPKEQKVFEIWNEPWDKMSPEDFSQLCQWIADVILKDRPDAIIGPNLFGNTGPYEYDARLIKAGGMKGMKMVALHPYASSENREWMRGYRQWLKDQLGREMEIYITEYGSHSTPEGPACRSELEQARRVVRQSHALYAEGVKALIPHWAGQSEQNRTYLEDWFGFIRKNEEPKPVLIAHANAARLVDGSHYLGDLWYGPQVAAMLFEKNGTHILALWTMGDAGGENKSVKEIELEPGVPEVLQTDMMGRDTTLKTEGGKLKLKLDEAPIYLVGVSPEMAKLATKELRADRWPQPEKAARNIRKAKRFQAPPALEGKFGDWKGAAEVAMLNPKVNGYDCSGTGYLAWDERYLYVGVDLRDNEMFNKESRAKLYRGDSVELFVSSQPRETGSGYGPDDHQFVVAPISGEGKPIFAEVTDREAGVLTDVKDAKYFAGLTHNADKGWAVEAAIPWSALPGFKPAKGARLALEFRVNDADTSHERFKIDATDASAAFQTTNPTSWSLLQLEE